MAIFRGQGFLFYFLLAAPHPFIAHSIRCGATLMLLPAGGVFLPAFLPASCFPLQPEQTPAGCFARSRLSNFRSWPSTQGFLACHWLLFAASMSRVWLACRLHAGTTGRVCLLVSCGHVLPKPVASCSTFSLLLLAEVTIIFRRKDSMRSGAA